MASLFATGSTSAQTPGLLDTPPVLFPDSVASLQRTRLQTQNPLDMSAAYADDQTTVTLYFFRPTNPNAALWFERAEAMLVLARDSNGLAAAVPGAVAPVTTPGSPSANGFRRTYAITEGGTATSVMVAEANGWVAKLRATSRTLTPAALDALVDQATLALKANSTLRAPNPQSLPVDCGSSANEGGEALEKLTRPSEPQAGSIGVQLMAGTIALELATANIGGKDSLAARPDLYCRIRNARDLSIGAVYQRKGKLSDGWTMLIADSGRSLSSAPMPSLKMPGDKATIGAMLTVNHLDRIDIVTFLNKLDDPGRAAVVALDMLRGQTPSPFTSVPYGKAEINLSK